MVVDIACGVEVDPDDPGATAEYEGQRYHFCSEGCKDHFEADPERYVEAEFPYLQEIRGMRTTRMPYGGTPGEFHLSVGDEHDLDVGDEVTLTRRLGDEEAGQFAKIPATLTPSTSTTRSRPRRGSASESSTAPSLRALSAPRWPRFRA